MMAFCCCLLLLLFFVVVDDVVVVVLFVVIPTTVVPNTLHLNVDCCLPYLGYPDLFFLKMQKCNSKLHKYQGSVEDCSQVVE